MRINNYDLTLVSSVIFDPWPFADDYVKLGPDVTYITSGGWHMPDPPVSGYLLNKHIDCILVALSNGDTAVSNKGWDGVTLRPQK